MFLGTDGCLCQLGADCDLDAFAHNNGFTRCGDIGSSVTAPGRPSASSMAPAMAPPTPLMPPSPAPLRPSGWSEEGASSVKSLLALRQPSQECPSQAGFSTACPLY